MDGKKKGGRDTVGGSHTNYLRKRLFEYQLEFSPQSLDRGARFLSSEKG